MINATLVFAVSLPVDAISLFYYFRFPCHNGTIVFFYNVILNNFTADNHNFTYIN